MTAPDGADATISGSSAPRTAGFGVWRVVAAAGLCGFSCMAAELTAVRVLAPHFGDSSYVWTNVIGVILAALAAGAWTGGRLAGRTDAAMWPFRLWIVASCLLAAAPFVASPLGGWLLPADLPLDAAMPAIVRGSFVATAVLFAPPMLLLGAVSPLLVTGLVRARVPVGRAAGAVAAVGTLGSLAGTFASTHWLVPDYGCRTAMSVAALALVVAAACVSRAGRGLATVVSGLCLGACLPWLHGSPLRQPPPGRELLAERESRYQFLQVQREVGVPGARRTMLVVNEGLDSFHSLHVEGSSLTGGAYYDWHALAPLLAGDGRRPEGLRALSIGDAAGSLRTVYAGVHPGVPVDAVDIDVACGELGAMYFAGEKAPGNAFVVDGRVFLERTQGAWHVIHVDAYAHQVYVPAHLASREFFTAARRRLLPGGILICNVGALHGEDPVLRAIGTTMGTVFGHALALPVPDSRNFVLVGRNGSPPAPACLASFEFGRERLTATDADAWRRVVQIASNPAAWVDVSTGGQTVTDDRPVLDRLLHASYVAREDPGAPIACEGTDDPTGAEVTAFGHRQARRWHELLATVRGSRRPSAYLRELAGDARWSLRQMASAVAEYEAALRLTDDADAQKRLLTKADTAREELAPIERARLVASRNGWLEAVIWVVLLAVVWRVRPVN